ncbi:IS110 family RNA-guided transposase [Rhizobium sp. LEGMi198b]
MKEVATIGLDIAKNVFQVHAADAVGATVFNRKLQRSEVLGFFHDLPPCLVGLEACASAHHWARSIQGVGHEVRLIHPPYVKPFVKRGKTDAADAEAINEALTRKTMRFVPIKSISQQALAMLFRTRSLLVRQKAQSVNALRSHLAELGIVAARGRANVPFLSKFVRESGPTQLPPQVCLGLEIVVSQIERLQDAVEQIEREIKTQAKRDRDIDRLTTIPGVGPTTAVAIKALVPDPSGFKSARHFAAWIGLTPKSHSSGESRVLGPVSRMGNRQLRSLLVIGAMAVLSHVNEADGNATWISRLKRRRPFMVAAVAVASKTARIIWALLRKGGVFVRPPGISLLDRSI